MGHGIAVDAAGSAYVVGLSAHCGCLSPSQVPYPTTAGAYNSGATQSTNFEIGVTKLSPDGSSLVYSTYFGGTTADLGYGIALDSSNDAYVTGFTISGDFPTLNTSVPFGSGLRGGVNNFVTELNPSGSGIIYSTYLGSSSADEAQNIAVDGAGSAYVVGWTVSTDYPTTSNAFQQSNPQTSLNSGGFLNSAGFLSKLSVTSGTVGLAYSTYVANVVGNSATLPQGGAQLYGVAVDSVGNAYVAGQSGINFPVTTGPAYAGNPVDALIARFDTTQSGSASLIYARNLGGSSLDSAKGIALVPGCASSCNAYVGGITSSADFASAEVPVNPGAAQHSFGGQEDGFLAEVGPAGALIYATYLGGAGFEQVLGLGVDGAGQVYATGTTDYIDFPTTAAAFQPSFQPPNGGLWETTTTAYPAYPTPAGWASSNGTLGLTSIALDPSTTPATIYASSLRTGIFKSTNGGATFNSTAFSIPGATSITINTNTSPATLYWTTGTAGIFESTDGLNTYSSPGALPAGTICCLTVAVEADAPSNLYLGTTSTFYRSTDGGAHFAQATGLPTVQVNAIIADGAGNLFIGTDRGIFMSTNHGASFSATNMNFSTVWVLAADTTNHIVYAGDFGNPVVSSNDGFNSNFVFGSTGVTSPTAYSLAVDPENPSTVYLGVSDSGVDWGEVLKSTDSGHTFASEDAAFQGAVLPIAIDSTTSPETLYWGTYQETQAFLTQLSADGSHFLFSTYLGGSNGDDARGLAVDSTGSAYVVGTTHSSDFPATAGAYQTSLGAGGPGFSNLLVAKYPNTLASSTGSSTTAPSSTTNVTFSNLTSPGTTTVTTSNTGPTPPAGFNFSGTYYDFTTTSTFSGSVTVCVDYIPSNYADPSLLQLFHYQGGAWVSVHPKRQ